MAIPYIPTTIAKSTSAVPYWLVDAPGTLVARMKRWYGSAMTGSELGGGKESRRKNDGREHDRGCFSCGPPDREDGPGNYTRNCRGQDYFVDRLPPGGAQCETAFTECRGIVFNDSSVVRMTVGRIINARVICPASNDTPTLR